MKRSATVTIHPQALQHNLQQAKLTAPESKAMAVIKANAYGHGAVQTAGILHEIADAYAVACVAEAIELRDAKIKLPIMVLQGAKNEDELRAAASHNLRLVVHNLAQLVLLENFSERQKSCLEITLKINTGMHRLGFEPHLVKTIFTRLAQVHSVNPDSLWLMTHLSCADELNNDYSNQQIQLFRQANKEITLTNTQAIPCSIANSAGILGWPDSHAEWIRPGIMLYGSSPFSDANEENNRKKYNLQAAMTFTAPLIAIHQLNKGDCIGYGGSWCCPEDRRVGVIACGYADGYPRHAETGTPVWINQKNTRLLGRVSMDMIIIDLENIEARIGDNAELWGKNISVDSVAHHAETISYELLCNAGNLCS